MLIAKLWPLGLAIATFQPLTLATLAQVPISNPETKPQQVIVPIILNGREAGEILLSIFPDGQITFPGTSIVEVLGGEAIAEVIQAVGDSINGEGNLRLTTLEASGLAVIFDRRRLELQITVPPDKRPVRTATLRGDNIPATAATALAPSTFSGFLNVEMVGEYPWLSNSGNFGDRPLFLNLEGVVNYKGWVLETLGTVLGSQDTPFQRNYTGLVHDDRENNLRYFLGDFSLGGRGFQGSFLSGGGLQGNGEFLGAVVSRVSSLQPYEQTTPRGKFEFFLTEPSRVEVFINDRLVNQLVLPAGPQALENLNLTTGLNNVYVLITDSTGTRRLDFSLPFDASLLAVGRSEFAYALGVNSTFTDVNRTYDFNQPSLILAHRQGILDNLTLGGFLQLDLQDQLASMEGLWATDIGRIGWAIAYSHSGEFGSGYGGRFGYLYQGKNDDPSQRSFDITADFYSPNFTRPGQLTLSNSYNYQLNFNYRQNLFDNLRFNVNGRYAFGVNQASAGSLSIGLSKPITPSLSLGVNINQDFGADTNQRSGLGLGLNIGWIPQRGQQIQANTNSATGRSQLGWSSSNSSIAGSKNSFLNWQNDDTSNYFNGGWRATNHRGSIALSQDVQIYQGAGDLAGGSFLRLESALVFADGAWGISRPVRDSFVIVAPHPALQGQVIQINPLRDAAVAKADSWGNGVLPDLTAYRVQQVRVDGPDLPLGVDLGPGSYNVLPSYKSGTLIRVGSDATVIVRGQLFAQDGEPISLKTIEIKSIDGGRQLTFLTNRAGKFVTEGFAPGSYEGKVTSNPNQTFRFTIPAGTAGLFDLGEVKLTD